MNSPSLAEVLPLAAAEHMVTPTDGLAATSEASDIQRPAIVSRLGNMVARAGEIRLPSWRMGDKLRSHLAIGALGLILTGCSCGRTEEPGPSQPATPISACPPPEALPAPWTPPYEELRATRQSAELQSIDFSTFLVRDNPIGLEKRLDQLAEAGVTEARFDTAMNVMEPERCKFDWTLLDPFMVGLSARHIRALMIAGKIPQWATDTPNCNAEGKCPPRDPADYGDFLWALARRYAAFMPNVEMVNEPRNISPEVYAKMCADGYYKFKQASPGSQVAIASWASTDSRLPYDPDRPSTFFKAVHAAGGCRFDAFNAHPYTSPAVPGQDDDANGWGSMLDLKRTADSLGYGDKPFWITEFGTPQPGEQLRQFDAALPLVNSPAYAWVTKFFWYTLRDDGPAHPFGAIDDKGSPRPLFGKIESYNASH